MRLKKWRGAQGILVFANRFQPDGDDGYPGPEVDVAITGSNGSGWVTSVKGKPPLTPKQAKQLEEDIQELVGVSPADGFNQLCKEVDW